MEWELRSSKAAGLHPSERRHSRFLPSTRKPKPHRRARTSLWKRPPGRTACYPSVPIVGTPQYCCSRCPPPRFAVYLEALTATPNVQHISPQWYSSPSSSWHKSPSLTFPNHSSDSVQTDLSTAFVHCSIACLRSISIESNKTQPVPIYVRTQVEYIEEAQWHGSLTWEETWYLLNISHGTTGKLFFWIM